MSFRLLYPPPPPSPPRRQEVTTSHAITFARLTAKLFWLKQVSTELRKLSLIRDESTVLLNKLAEQVEDFSVALMDQVNTQEESSIESKKENTDTYASLLDEITESAICFSQKKVIYSLEAKI